MGTMLYVATSEGVVTVKEGENQEWGIDKQGLNIWDVNEIAVEPSAPNRVYAATRGDGVWRSDDFGEKWTKPNRGRPGPGKVKCVTIDPHDSNTIYAGGEPIALWVSHDAGENWSEIATVREFPHVSSVEYPGAMVEPHVRDVVIDGGDRNIMYVNLQVGHMMKTTDGGATWVLLDNGVDADAHMLVSRKDDPKRLLLSTGGHSHRLGEAPGRALYRSENGGESWSPMGLEFDQEYSIPMVVNPKNEDIVYSALAYGNPGSWRQRESGAGTALIRSKDGGATWQKLEEPPEISCYYAEAITMDPSEPDNVFVATRAGHLFGSKDGGDTWTSLNVRVPDVSDLKAVHI
jgi:photosystem II stability/assembly factor-like uncharacterized protein